jgi:type IV pilus assembly protein PilO
MLEKVPFYGQVLIFLGLALGIVGMSYYVWPGLGEKREKIAGYQDQYADKERRILEGQTIEQRLPEFEREIANLERKLGDIEQILPSSQETGDLLRWIKNEADQSNLDLKSFAPGSLRPVEFYKEFPIEMQIVGRYHDLGLFLDRVSNYTRIINVDNLRINGVKSEDDRTIRASFTATTFVHDDASQPTEGRP